MENVNVLSELSVPEALEILKNDYGSTMIGRDMLYAGIEQGVFPFGICILMGDKRTIIFENQLRAWAEQRLTPKTVAETPKRTAETDDEEIVYV